MKGKPILWSVGFVGGGLILTLLVLYWNSAYEVQPKTLKALSIDFLQVIGLALFMMGTLTVILQVRSWKDYFEDGLSRIVLKQEFLNNLSDEELLALQVKTLKASFKNLDIDREGSFLRYFQQDMNQYLGCPYREDVSGTHTKVISQN
jgi:hypothetical protein